MKGLVEVTRLLTLSGTAGTQTQAVGNPRSQQLVQGISMHTHRASAKAPTRLFKGRLPAPHHTHQ